SAPGTWAAAEGRRSWLHAKGDRCSGSSGPGGQGQTVLTLSQICYSPCPVNAVREPEMIPNPWIGTPQTSEKEPIYIDEFMGLVDRGQAAVALRSDESAAVSGRWRLERGVYGARKGQLLHGVPADRPPILRFD